MGKNEKKALSFISPAYAISQGKLPGVLGLGVSALKGYKDRKDEEDEMSGKNQLDKASGEAIQMKKGGRVKSIDGCATRGKTRGRMC